jgi:hypothetical protein
MPHDSMTDSPGIAWGVVRNADHCQVPGAVAHTCNPSFSGGTDWEDAH